MWRPTQVGRSAAATAAAVRQRAAPTAAPVSAAPSGKPRPEIVVYVLWALVLVLCVQRCLYHLAYLRDDPFALITIADGQVYEAAARDILAAPWWGEKPFYLQGAYAYLLAIGMAPSGSIVGGLILQLIAAAAGLVLFGSAARACFGQRTGLVSVIVLLACPGVTFYENKYLSVVLAMFACMFLLWAFARTLDRPTFPNACIVGLSAGLCTLARPNLILVALFCAIGVWYAATRRSRLARAMLVGGVLVGALGAVTPMALRNLVVTGTPTIFPSHGGGIPFFIGNNPASNGRWNDAGGLLGRNVSLERNELAAKLGIRARGADLDAAIGGELYRRAFDYILANPIDWLALEGKKLWALTGNHDYVHDYDELGERELLGAAFPIGLPFGVALGLGALGLALLSVRAHRARHDASQLGLCWVLYGLVVATAVANLIWFTAAQHRVPLYVPLAFAAGPALDTLAGRLRRALPASALPLPACAVAALLCLQAFYPRSPVEKPSSTHYYNLANAEEELGRPEAALAHYALATERNPKQTSYWWRRAVLAQRMRRLDDARYALDQMLALPDLSPQLRQATSEARKALR